MAGAAEGNGTKAVIAAFFANLGISHSPHLNGGPATLTGYRSARVQCWPSGV